MNSDLDLAIRAATAGGEVVEAGFGRASRFRFKGDANPVTEVDEEAERAVLDILRQERPQDQILAEEAGGSAVDAPGRLWVIDPLDGTVNFIHGLPHVAVSVALWEGGLPRVGVILDPLRHEVFSAARGEGAQLDGVALEVSGESRMDRSLVVTGFPYDRRAHAAAYAHTLGAVLAQVQGVRRLGSAALDLAWVAAGRFGGYWEYGLKPWDSAAGALLVTEAGGVVTGLDGEAFRLDSPGVVAAAPGLHRALLTVVAANLPGHLR